MKPKGHTQSIKRILSNPGLIVTSFKTGAIAFGFAVNILIVRQTGNVDSGIFFYFLNLAMVFGVVGRLGNDLKIVRDTSQTNYSRSKTSIINFLAVVIPTTTIALLSILLLSSGFIELRNPETLLFLSISIIPTNLIISSSCILRGKRRFLSSDFFGVLAVPLTMTLVLLVFPQEDTIGIAQKHLISTSFIAVLTIYFLIRTSENFSLNDLTKIRFSNIFYAWKDSISFFAISLVTIAIQCSNTIILGLVGNAKDVSYYHTTLRTSACVLIISTILCGLTAPNISRLMVSKDQSLINSYFTASLVLGALLIIPPTLLAFYFSSSILLVFGSELVEADFILKILLVGQAITALSMPAIQFRQITKTSPNTIRIEGTCLTLLIILGLILSSKFGATGAAFTLLTISILRIFLYKWTSPIPNKVNIPQTLMTLRKMCLGQFNIE